MGRGILLWLLVYPSPSSSWPFCSGKEVHAATTNILGRSGNRSGCRGASVCGLLGRDLRRYGCRRRGIACAAMILGAGFGLSIVSPWSNSGVSAGTFAVTTAVGLVVIQWIASGRVAT